MRLDNFIGRNLSGVGVLNDFVASDALSKDVEKSRLNRFEPFWMSLTLGQGVVVPF